MGWEDEEHYYLLPRIAYECCKGSGLKLTIKPETLKHQLYEEGFLEVDPEGKGLTMVK